MEGVVYIPTDHKKISKNECSCKGSTVDEKCMFNNKCQKQATIYKFTWNPITRHYLGKTQDRVKVKISQHIHGLKPFINLRDRHNKYLEKRYYEKISKSKPKSKPKSTTCKKNSSPQVANSGTQSQETTKKPKGQNHGTIPTPTRAQEL